MTIEPALTVNESMSELTVCVDLSGEIQRFIDIVLSTTNLTAMGKFTSVLANLLILFWYVATCTCIEALVESVNACSNVIYTMYDGCLWINT